MDTQTSNPLDLATRKDVLSVKVAAPFRTYFEGIANSLSAVNGTGPFDILPGHHNFLSLLSACEVVVRTNDGEQRIQISRGVIHVRSNKVTVFLDL